MKPEGAMVFPVNPDLSEYSLEDAVTKLGPAWVYGITVSHSDLICVKNMLRKLCTQYVNNPFSPYFNLSADPGYSYSEWSASANGKTVWSPGA